MKPAQTMAAGLLQKAALAAERRLKLKSAAAATVGKRACVVKLAPARV